MRLLDTRDDGELESSRTAMIQEATELMNVFAAILRKSEHRTP